MHSFIWNYCSWFSGYIVFFCHCFLISQKFLRTLQCWSLLFSNNGRLFRAYIPHSLLNQPKRYGEICLFWKPKTINQFSGQRQLNTVVVLPLFLPYLPNIDFVNTTRVDIVELIIYPSCSSFSCHQSLHYFRIIL